MNPLIREDVLRRVANKLGATNRYPRRFKTWYLVINLSPTKFRVQDMVANQTAHPELDEWVCEGTYRNVDELGRNGGLPESALAAIEARALAWFSSDNLKFLRARKLLEGLNPQVKVRQP